MDWSKTIYDKNGRVKGYIVELLDGKGSVVTDKSGRVLGHTRSDKDGIGMTWSRKNHLIAWGDHPELLINEEE